MNAQLVDLQKWSSLLNSPQRLPHLTILRILCFSRECVRASPALSLFSLRGPSVLVSANAKLPLQAKKKKLLEELQAEFGPMDFG